MTTPAQLEAAALAAYDHATAHVAASYRRAQAAHRTYLEAEKAADLALAVLLAVRTYADDVALADARARIAAGDRAARQALIDAAAAL